MYHPQKFAPTLALNRHPWDLIGQAKVFDICTSNQNQSGKCIFSRGVCRLTRKRRVLQGAVCHLAARIDNNIIILTTDYSIF